MQLEEHAVEAAEQTPTVLCNPSAPTPVDHAPAQSPHAMPDVGDVLFDRWQILAWAGLGSASIVFRGEHREMRFPVAVKIVNRQHYAVRSIAIGHLRNEAQVLSRLRHPHHARMWDFHEDCEHPYLVTDFVDGITLAQTIRLVGRVEPRRAIRLALYIADVLRYVWREGLVHRDVKPENIMLAADGSAKLIDFGLSIVRGEENAIAHGEQTIQPRIGTVAYMPPEQIRNSAAVDHRADMYALGATLYHTVTGQLPFRGTSAAQIMLQHIESDPLPPNEVCDAPKPVSDLILRLMSRNPAQRFDDSADLISALKTIQQTLRSAPEPA